MPSPTLNHDLRFGPVSEPFQAQAFISELPVEGFVGTVLQVALRLEHAVFPKQEWLANLGAPIEWPMFGRMKALHSDNGREFHSSAFRRGCDLNRIDLIYRPPATPRFGGHVERLIGRVRLLPGNSYSDLLKRRPSRAESKASLTLEDLKVFLALDIARYHERTHRGLGLTPRTAWEQTWAREANSAKVELPDRTDRTRCLLDFMPSQRRVVGREGIQLFGLIYSDRSLKREVDPGRQRVIRFDPRDVSRVYLERSSRSYLTIPLRDHRIPALSMWEWRAIRKHQREIACGADGERIGQFLAHFEQVRTTTTPLRRRRAAARIDQWREVQARRSISSPTPASRPMVTSPSHSGDLVWEILQ